MFITDIVIKAPPRKKRWEKGSMGKKKWLRTSAIDAYMTDLTRARDIFSSALSTYSVKAVIVSRD